MSSINPSRIPRATYRLQLNHLFPFADAEAIAPYLAQLGVSELYSSPFFAAQPGSMHGYDLCDHSRLNPELGGHEGFDRLSQTLERHGLGLVLDFVPNHMSTNPAANPWWRDVLANGPSSPYAAFFDIDWDPVKDELKNKILLPLLGDQYGITLESGQLRVTVHDGEFQLRYFDLDLPLNPRQILLILGHQIEPLAERLGPDAAAINELRSILFHLEHMPAYTETDPQRVESRQRERDVAMRRIATLTRESSAIREHIDDNVRDFNGTPGVGQSFDLLHELLEAQPYRLSSWRTAMHEINYRRFFDINELAGIRMEEPEAFTRAHELLFDLICKGQVTGLRLDHIDGLYHPSRYLESVMTACGPERIPYLVVEKILSEGEELQTHWHAHGTTGYEFLNDLNGLFVDQANEHKFLKLHQRFSDQELKYADVVYNSKKLIIQTSMASELNVLAHELNRISECHREFRDFTLDSLQEALREIVACFPVYRSYAGPDGWGDFDERNVDQAVSGALRRNPALEPSIFHFIRRMLLPERANEIPQPEFARRLRFAMKFQQYTGPVQAKGVEDTAFYRYAPLLSLNEVGGEADRFGRSPEEFHAANTHRQDNWPLAMLTTSTHDTKRGEDARARINVLSEIPAEFGSAISRWARANASARTMLGQTAAPDRSDEYLYYQALVGAWPAGLTERPDGDFVDRMRGYMQKAMKEKKTHTSWIHPSAGYDNAVSTFVEKSLTGRNSRAFLALFLPFQQRVANLGIVNSLSQLVLKIGAPGVPDFYQGSELWDFSLVDPDNRRPVDFAARQQLLNNMAPLFQTSDNTAARTEAISDMLLHGSDGRIKLFCTAAGLGLRKRLPDVFCGGHYQPLVPEGPASRHVVAFARSAGQRNVLVIAPRLVTGLSGFSNATPPTGPGIWSETTVALPEGLATGLYRNIFTGETLTAAEGHLLMADVFKVLPVAILEQINPEEALA